MSAGIYNITIDQNATFQLDIYWETDTTPAVPIDVTGYTAKMQIRSQIGSPTVLATLTDSNGGVVLGTTDGHIKLVISASATNAYTWTSGVYDLDIVSPAGFTTRLLQGTVTINQAVTII